jgi:hypothetical protein
MYFESDTAVTVSNDKIKLSTADLIYVKNGDRPIATMALAFIENDQYKWLSRDGVMFITKNGRLVQTVGLEKNLIYVSDLSTDPLALSQANNKEMQWNRVIDTEHGDYGANLSSQFSTINDELIWVQDEQFKTIKHIESVHYQSEKYGEDIWTNTFWFHHESGQLLKSSQKVSPQSETVEITYLSRAVRLLEQ